MLFAVGGPVELEEDDDAPVVAVAVLEDPVDEDEELEEEEEDAPTIAGSSNTFNVWLQQEASFPQHQVLSEHCVSN